jgi:hypothetical protein
MSFHGQVIFLSALRLRAPFETRRQESPKMIGISPRESLVSISDLDGDNHALLERHGGPIRQVVKWAREYLSQPHPALGRKGPVCPFVPKSMEKNLFFLTVCPELNPGKDQVRQTVLTFRDVFTSLQPTNFPEAQFKTILILFPYIPRDRVTALIDETQAELSFEFTPRGLMVGEFHDGPPNKPGLWNPDFRPLDCPVPMLVIRHMVDTDILFLQREKDLVVNYLERFGTRVPRPMFNLTKDAVARFGIDFPRLARKKNESTVPQS